MASVIEQTVRTGKPFPPVTDLNALKLGVANGVTVGASEQWGPYHKTTLNLTEVSISIVDSGGAAGGQGSLKVYDFPEGITQILGAACNLTTRKGGAGITDTSAVVGSVGSVAAGAGDATLTGTEADIIPSIVGTLVAGAGTLKGKSAAPAAPFDGSVTPLDAILNIATVDAGITATTPLIVNGQIVIIWTSILDF